VIGVAAVALAACSSGHAAEHARNTDPIVASGTPSSTVPGPTTTASPLGSGQPVVLAFGGDVHFEGILHDKLAAGAGSVLAPIAPVVGSADLAMVNLETAVTLRGSPQAKTYTFRAPSAAFTALSSAGIDVATMANNHGMDYGAVGLQDSLAAVQASHFPVVGIGATEAQAYAPYRTTIKGQRISIIGATQVIDENLIAAWTATPDHGGLASAKRVDRLVQEVQAARANSDTVVVFLHWGVEQQNCPSDAQRTIAQQLVDAGADIVIGSHAHVLLGAGHLGNAFVDYGLGNFAFYATDDPYTRSGVLFLTVTGRHVDDYTWKPARIEGGVPHPLTGSAATSAVTSWHALRSCTNLAP
jgi:poly-gamma-glutamate synthesis protein (capsule biosynthesis protein)